MEWSQEIEERFNNDPFMQGVQEQLKKQFEKGVTKYGATLYENPKELPLLEMLDYLAEELVDGLVYIQALKKMMAEAMQSIECNK